MYSYKIRGSLKLFLRYQYWCIVLDRLVDLESSLLSGQLAIPFDRLEVFESSLLPDLCVDGFNSD